MQKFNVYESATRRQALGVSASSLAGAVRPWFAECGDEPRVAQAIANLAKPSARGEASRFLGLELVNA